MAWTDYSSTPANSWAAGVGTVAYDASVNTRDGGEELFNRATIDSNSPVVGINSLVSSYNIPGFDDGYQPEGVNNPIAGDLGGGSGGGGGVAVRGTYIDSDSEADTAWTGAVPSHFEGDLLIAVIMTRDTGGLLTLPTGWTQQGSAYLSNLQFNGGSQSLKVFTKVATASDPTTATWTQASSSRICGLLVSMVGNDFAMGTAAHAYGNADEASITNAGADFYLTAATWIYSATSGSETYSQSGSGLTQITDSPMVNARMSGGYTSTSGVVQSSHETDTADDDPNHGIISIPFIASGGGGGSPRPTSGFLYPRGQG